jgi:hypothetical protein
VPASSGPPSLKRRRSGHRHTTDVTAGIPDFLSAPIRALQLADFNAGVHPRIKNEFIPGNPTRTSDCAKNGHKRPNRQSGDACTPIRVSYDEKLSKKGSAPQRCRSYTCELVPFTGQTSAQFSRRLTSESGLSYRTLGQVLLSLGQVLPGQWFYVDWIIVDWIIVGWIIGLVIVAFDERDDVFNSGSVS